ncbi:grpE protein homolog 2, mitochondrial isoform X2 [Cryptomeria japonica]|uniref:grpE protein homolog 2, mitochondrial isoform X2 n=1 Tax=Cryptomeria japonica TaxID=3369 RepID=UPI0025ABB2A5|nr:grpE protein homolog 2, mitochondrial isoform X2 [Cryptomeria japonica]
MNSTRSLTGLLRKGFTQSRGFKLPANSLLSKRCHAMQENIQSPHKLLLGSCETVQAFSRPQLPFLTQKLSLFSSVTSQDLSQKESNTDSSTESSLGNKGEEPGEPVCQKQPDSVGKGEAVKRAQPELKNNVKKNESVSESESDEEKEFSTEDLIRLVEEKEELLKVKHKEIQSMQEKVLRSYAEVENVMDRTRRDAENSKKFAIQSFAKSLLDVADNLGRASSVAKESFSKLDASKDSNGAAALLKTLLEGVEMTEKQLSDVFKKYGIEKFDPINEQFDPHRHMAVFQLPDATWLYSP